MSKISAYILAIFISGKFYEKRTVVLISVYDVVVVIVVFYFRMCLTTLSLWVEYWEKVQ